MKRWHGLCLPASLNRQKQVRGCQSSYHLVPGRNTTGSFGKIVSFKPDVDLPGMRCRWIRPLISAPVHRINVTGGQIRADLQAAQPRIPPFGHADPALVMRAIRSNTRLKHAATLAPASGRTKPSFPNAIVVSTCLRSGSALSTHCADDHLSLAVEFGMPLDERSDTVHNAHVGI